MYLLCIRHYSRHWDIMANKRKIPLPFYHVLLLGKLCLICNHVSTLRFLNTLHKEVNINLGADISLNVGENYDVSAYRTVQIGE